MRKIDAEALGAFADGELPPAERAEVERALAEDADLRAEFEAQQRLRAALAGHYHPVGEEPVPEQLRALLERPPSNVVPIDSGRTRGARFAWPQWAAMAASLAVGIVAGQSLWGPSDSPVAVSDGAMLARGELAALLETRLASTQRDEARRIGLTFADRQGRICRTFEDAALTGIACREGSEWVLVRTAAGTRGGEYRQAGASTIAEQAAAMMSGEAFDAEAEHAARERGWRLNE